GGLARSHAELCGGQRRAVVEAVANERHAAVLLQALDDGELVIRALAVMDLRRLEAQRGTDGGTGGTRVAAEQMQLYAAVGQATHQGRRSRPQPFAETHAAGIAAILRNADFG